jgi:hypothetical protein
MTLIPIIQVIAMIVTASMYSNYWKDYVILFNFGIGMFLTCVTAHLNLASSAGYKFNPFYLDPIVFWIILYLDANQLVESQYIECAYIYLMV